MSWSISVKTVVLNQVTTNNNDTNNTSTSNIHVTDNTSNASSTSSNNNNNDDIYPSIASKPQPTNFIISISPEDFLATLYDQITWITGLTAIQQRLIYRGRLIHDPINAPTVSAGAGSRGGTGTNATITSAMPLHATIIPCYANSLFSYSSLQMLCQCSDDLHVRKKYLKK